jgi:hypothetical protein
MIVTLAPATTAPLESVTVPRMVPLTLCATTAGADKPRQSAMSQQIRKPAEPAYLFISSSLAELV